MTNFKNQKKEVNDSLDWGFYGLSYIQRTCQNWYDFLTTLPTLNTLPMRFSLNSISRILRCYSYIFHWNQTTYKFFTPLGRTIKNFELNGNRKALQTNFWSGNVMEVNSYPLSLAMVKGLPVPVSNLAWVEEFISSKLQEALTYELQQCHMTYNIMKLQKLGQQGLDLRLLEQCHDLLRPLKLPITSAHGDLHIDNIILVNQEISIIDWSMYNRNGSFITDYIHFYNYSEAVKNNESWTVAILKDQEYLYALADKLNTEPVLLKMIYTLNRIAGEVSQFTKTHLVPENQIDKYNSVLSQFVITSKQHV